MSETKEAIKLFGETIPLPATQIPANPKEKLDVGRQIQERSDVMDACGEIARTETMDGSLKDYGKSDKSSVTVDGKEDHGDEARVNPKPNEELAETSSADQEKVIKKPDKVIPCPRCNSLETKFCYFNNYNVNQPRHFCKSCQRYWTAGGTMRNVPVGAGRRKNKHLTSQDRQILVSPSGVPITRIDVPDSTNQHLLSCGQSTISSIPSAGNGTLLKFSSEGPSSESVATVLHLREQKNCTEMASARENGEELSSCSSSMTACNILENEIPKKVIPRQQGGLSVTSNELSPPHRLHCHLVPPWVFNWNPSWNSAASMVASECSSELISPPEGSNPNPIQWCSTPMLPVPGSCTPNIPLRFVPASYWGCVPFWAAGTRNIPFTGSAIAPSSSSFTNNSCSGNNLPILGKHSRDTSFMDEQKSENCLLVPKTLRIDDLGEASKSSIWATLGFKSEQKETKLGGDISKPCKSSAEVEDHSSDTTQILEANPAALSRSQTFQERT